VEEVLAMGPVTTTAQQEEKIAFLDTFITFSV
jgi:hypothetical protein